MRIFSIFDFRSISPQKKNMVLGRRRWWVTTVTRVMASFSTASSASSSSAAAAKLKVALCQVSNTGIKATNLAHMEHMVTAACARHAPDLVILPEIWNSPYATSSFPVNAEPVPEVGGRPDPAASPSTALLCAQARKHGIWLVGGSVPERETDAATGAERVYNTCLVFNPLGDVVGKHRKVHLFDIDVPGRMTFKESDSLTGGSGPCIVDTPWGKVGVGICYDIRFPELSMVMRQRGCKLLVFPGAFNMVTGPAHWELLQRARAVDNQLFVAACSPARVEGASYVAYGHSSVVSPWGEVLAQAGAGEEVVYAELDMQAVDTMRQNIPCWTQKRHDLYELIDKGPM